MAQTYSKQKEQNYFKISLYSNHISSRNQEIGEAERTLEKRRLKEVAVMRVSASFLW